MKRVCVIGLDGANWELISPWLNSGDLPNLSLIKENGVSGVLKSQYPPVTFPNWKCYSTGKNPGKLGVFWFELFDRERNTITFPNAKSFHSAELWDYLNIKGIKTGIINMPTTFPPRRINGFMIAGGPLCADTSYTYPPTLENYLVEKFRYTRGLKHSIDVSKKSCEGVAEALRLIKLRFDVALDLWEKYSEINFLHITIFFLNVLQHHFYRDEPVFKAWKIIDKYIGEFIKKNITVFLVSDHGCGKVEHIFYINTWLEKEGYLKTRLPVSRSIFNTIGIDRRKLSIFTEKIGIKKMLKMFTPDSIRKIVPKEDGRYKNKEELIDWENTVSFGSGQGIIYLTLARQHDEYYSIREKIKSKLARLQIPNTSKYVAKNIYNGEEVYKAENMDDIPDIVFEQNEFLHTNGDIGNKVVFGVPKRWQAENITDGFFGAIGKDLKEGYCISDCNIVDVAPTLLYFFDVDIPEDMDGKVRKDIFKESSLYFRKKVSYQKPISVDNIIDTTNESPDEEKMRNQLRRLGYIE